MELLTSSWLEVEEYLKDFTWNNFSNWFDRATWPHWINWN